MRETCRDCARKHVAQAIILATEERLGYPQFKWLVVGHLAEAETELLIDHPDVANKIRDFRKEYEIDTAVNMPMMELLDEITRLDEAAKEPKPEPKKRAKKE